MSEFDLIERYFTWDIAQYDLNDTETSHIVKSVGDDAAVLALAPSKHIVTSIDTLVSGVHFPEDTCAYDIAYKALAVNLSDIAAMGAIPEWFTLALTLPKIDHSWLSDFSAGLKALAIKSGVALVGGDTTSGPLAMSIQVIGSVDKTKALYRNGAKVGDKIYVTGTLGDGKAGLLSVQGDLQLNKAHAKYCQDRLNRPTPRVTESYYLKEFATSCIDVSDGLLQDLSHILEQSNLENSDAVIGAELDLTMIPLSDALMSDSLYSNSIDTTINASLRYALTGGDDYELLFTIPSEIEHTFINNNTAEHKFTCIGEITEDQGIVDKNKTPLNKGLLNKQGFNHFS